MADANLTQQTKLAIESLSSANQEQQRAANQWLTEFEKSTVAWTIADELVREPTGSSHR